MKMFCKDKKGIYHMYKEPSPTSLFKSMELTSKEHTVFKEGSSIVSYSNRNVLLQLTSEF